MTSPQRPWTSIDLTEALTGMRSMLSDEEKQYLVWLTSERYEGWGSVVDLGPWLGSSSAALAEGLRRRGLKTRVQSFDCFVWETASTYMARASGERLEGGADFLPLFLSEIGAYERWIVPRKQDLLTYVWDEGPIEILFVDAAKSWDLTNAILRGFGHALVPGRTRVVLQDFRYDETYWLPLVFDSRPDLWREIESVEIGTTVTFVARKHPEGPSGIDAGYSEDTFPPEASERLFRERMARESPRNAALFLRMLYRVILLDGTPAEARAIRAQLIESGIPPADLERLEDLSFLLVPRGWEAFRRGDFAAALAIARRCLEGGRRPPLAIALEGMSRLRLGEVAEASARVEEVAARLPDLPDVRLYRAEVALAEQRLGDAAAHAVEGLRHTDGAPYLRPWALALLRRLYRARLLDGTPGEVQAIRTHLLGHGVERQELVLLEDLETELVPRGWAAFDRGDFAAALSIARRCSEGRDPRPVYALALEGMSRLRLGEIEEARSCIGEVATRVTGVPDVLLYRAELALAEQRWSDASGDVVEALCRHPDGPSYLLPWSLGILARVRAAEGPREEHLAALRALLACRPREADVLVQIAEEQLRLGRKAEAMRTFETAIEVAPGHEAAERLRVLRSAEEGSGDA